MIEKVRNYIDKQEVHHQKKTFEEAYEELLKHFLVMKDLENSVDHYKLNTGR
jgi:hypothetical protein